MSCSKAGDSPSLYLPLIVNLSFLLFSRYNPVEPETLSSTPDPEISTDPVMSTSLSLDIVPALPVQRPASIPVNCEPSPMNAEADTVPADAVILPKVDKLFT